MSTTASTTQGPGGFKGFVTSSKTTKSVAFFGICTAIAVVALGILSLLTFTINPKSVIVTIYQIFFGLMLLGAEFKLKVQMKWFRFMAPHFGLGMFYLFVAVFVISDGEWWQIVIAAVCLAVSLIHLLLGCYGVNRYEPPANEETLERDIAVKYASNKAQQMNTAENRAGAANAAMSASAHLEEGQGASANPFENPFESNGASGNYKSAYN